MKKRTALVSTMLLFQCSFGENVTSVRTPPGTEKASGNANPEDSANPSNPPKASNSANPSNSPNPSVNPKDPPTPYPTGLIAPEDFTFLGSYPVSVDAQMTFGMAMTIRYVNNELRFLATSYSGPVGCRIVEFKLPSTGFGTDITAAYKTNQWDNIWNPHDPTNDNLRPGVGGGDAYSLWWEDQGNETGRLWTTHAIDYPDDVNKLFTQNIAVRNLNSNGSISNHFYEYGVEGIGQRAIYGGVRKIPESFRAENGLAGQPYIAGWGGYASRMAQGLAPSMGFMAVAIPASAAKIIADHRSGAYSSVDWYTNPGFPKDFDRGVRNSDVLNYFNIPVDFTKPPVGSWLSPAPDGKGRWVWGDSFYNTGNWIVGENKQGFIAIGSFSRDKAYYANSTLHRDRRHAELQIFNPKDFADSLKGIKKPWNVEPYSSKLLTADLEPLGLLYGSSGFTWPGGVAAAAFDPKTKILWLWCPAVDGGYGIRLVAYRVNI